jgi:single-stranded-DNA-specific exonuclease
LVSVDGLTLYLLDQLDRAGPYGMGNPGVRLVIPRAKVVSCDRMKDKHLRAMLSDASSKRRVAAVTFNSVGTPLGDLLEASVGRQLHVAGTARRNRWQGNESVQFMIDDIATT